jgi:hypothetical protein
VGASEPGTLNGWNGMSYYDQPSGGTVLSGIILFMGVLGMMFMGLLDIWF